VKNNNRLTRWSAAVAVLSFLAIGAHANPVQLDTQSYNFQLSGGGGGASATLGSNQNIQIFCVDFANEIYVPHTGYSAYLSTLTDGSDLSKTRFGSNSSWTTVTIDDGDSDDAADSAIINSADALDRYQMAAFLVTQYQVGQGSNASNNGIQAAIWAILDPSSSGAAPSYANDNNALELAAAWFSNPNSDKSFLANFRIVSDSKMTSDGPGNPLTGGFQEQLTMVPEPRAAVWILIVLLSICAVPLRKVLAVSSNENQSR
jgi:hypothetical protein